MLDRQLGRADHRRTTASRALRARATITGSPPHWSSLAVPLTCLRVGRSKRGRRLQVALAASCPLKPSHRGVRSLPESMGAFQTCFSPSSRPRSNRTPPTMGYGICHSQLIPWLGETIPLRTRGGKVPEGRHALPLPPHTRVLLSHGPSGRGGRARHAVTVGSSQKLVGGRGGRRRLRVASPLPCRPGDRARPPPTRSLPSTASPVVAPSSSWPAWNPGWEPCAPPARRSAHRPRHGRRRQRAQQGAQPATTLPLRLLGVSEAQGRGWSGAGPAWRGEGGGSCEEKGEAAGGRDWAGVGPGPGLAWLGLAWPDLAGRPAGVPGRVVSLSSGLSRGPSPQLAPGRGQPLAPAQAGLPACGGVSCVQEGPSEGGGGLWLRGSGWPGEGGGCVSPGRGRGVGAGWPICEWWPRGLPRHSGTSLAAFSVARRGEACSLSRTRSFSGVVAPPLGLRAMLRGLSLASHRCSWVMQALGYPAGILECGARHIPAMCPGMRSSRCFSRRSAQDNVTNEGKMLRTKIYFFLYLMKAGRFCNR